MRARASWCAPAVLALLAACGEAEDVASRAVVPLPSAVSCTDAAQLRRRASDDRRRSAATSSDHEKIDTGNRAGFFASLAIVADLKCKVTLPEADAALEPAFEAARAAQNSHSMYERAQKWSDASFIATEVIALLLQKLPASPSN
jgi:hypothetical protein